MSELLTPRQVAELVDTQQVGGRRADHLVHEQVLPPLPQVAERLQIDPAPDLYRAVAAWPGYLDVAWAELQHLAAYPDFRRRGRALYFYARSSARFLAVPLEADPEALAARGVGEAEIAAARTAIDRALPVLATMMMHCSAMRFALGITTREVVASG